MEWMMTDSILKREMVGVARSVLFLCVRAKNVIGVRYWLNKLNKVIKNDNR